MDSEEKAMVVVFGVMILLLFGLIIFVIFSNIKESKELEKQKQETQAKYSAESPHYRIIKEIDALENNTSVHYIYFKDVDTPENQAVVFKRKLDDKIIGANYTEGAIYTNLEMAFLSPESAEKIVLRHKQAETYKIIDHSSEIVNGKTEFTVYFQNPGNQLKYFKKVDMDTFVILLEQGKCSSIELPLSDLMPLEKVPVMAEKPDQKELPKKKKEEQND